LFFFFFPFWSKSRIINDEREDSSSLPSLFYEEDHEKEKEVGTFTPFPPFLQPASAAGSKTLSFPFSLPPVGRKDNYLEHFFFLRLNQFRFDGGARMPFFFYLPFSSFFSFQAGRKESKRLLSLCVDFSPEGAPAGTSFFPPPPCATE